MGCGKGAFGVFHRGETHGQGTFGVFQVGFHFGFCSFGVSKGKLVGIPISDLVSVEDNYCFRLSYNAKGLWPDVVLSEGGCVRVGAW